MKLPTIRGYIFGAVVGLTLGTTFLVHGGAFTAFTGMTQAWFDAVKLKLDGTYTSAKMCTSDASGTIQCITDVPGGGVGQTAGSATAGFLNYAGTTKTAGQLDGGTTAPSNTTRLNYDGDFYANSVVSTTDITVNGLRVGKGGGNIASNTAVGNIALNANTTGYSNTAVGKSTLFTNTTGYLNTANGAESLYANTTGFGNTANGNYSLYANTTGYSNTANGGFSLYTNTTGYSNTANGAQALYSNTTGGYNTANGSQSLFSNTTGYGNTVNGYGSLYSNKTGINGVAIGYNSQFYANDTTTAWTNYNTSVGYESLKGGVTASLNTGNNNSAFGYSSLFANTTGGGNTANGAYTLYANTTGVDNTANGMTALYSNTTGNYNTANGRAALQSNTAGGYNTANGRNALYSNTIGSNNTAVGLNALYYNTTGVNNTAVGLDSGMKNLINLTGSFNTFLGVAATYTVGTITNATAVGANASVDASNKVRIGDTAVTVIAGQVAWTTTSDRRWKDDIQDVPLGLAFIKALRPVDYFRKNDEAKKREAGFIAQEVESVLTEFGYKNTGMLTKDGDGYYSLRYNDFMAPIVKSIQEISTTTDEVIIKIKKLEDENKSLRELVCLDHPSAKICR